MILDHSLSVATKINVQIVGPLRNLVSIILFSPKSETEDFTLALPADLGRLLCEWVNSFHITYISIIES